jgi:hypothetical protein
MKKTEEELPQWAQIVGRCIGYVLVVMLVQQLWNTALFLINLVKGVL